MRWIIIIDNQLLFIHPVWSSNLDKVDHLLSWLYLHIYQSVDCKLELKDTKISEHIMDEWICLELDTALDIDVEI